MKTFLNILFSIALTGILLGCGGTSDAATYTATDPYQNGMPIATFTIPSGWQGHTEVNYNRGTDGNFCTVRVNFQAPDGSWASFCRPLTLTVNQSIRQTPFVQNPQALAETVRTGLFDFVPGLNIHRVRSARFEPCTNPHLIQSHRKTLQMIGNPNLANQLQMLVAEYDAQYQGRAFTVNYATALSAVDMPSPMFPMTMLTFMVQSATLAPAEQSEAFAQQAAAVLVSAQDNPQWVQLIDNLTLQRAQITNQAQQQRMQTWRQTQQEISEIRKSAYQNASDTQDRVADLYDQAIREVDVHPDAFDSSRQVESSSLYNHAFQNSDGTILNTDSIESPGVDWQRLK